MSWFTKPKFTTLSSKPVKKIVPDGTWIKCKKCEEMYPAKELEENLKVCPKCGYHNRLTANEWIKLIIDKDTFIPKYENIVSGDPLDFADSKPYKQRLADSTAKSKTTDAIICGKGDINGHPVALGVMNFFFMGGSMGSVVGERIVRLTEFADKEKLPLIIFSSSGGARMQEGILSLMQMARTSAAIANYQKNGGLYISVLTDPTTGGTTASFASLGDLIITEPGALIGFAGPRVIEQTIRQKLPQKFQTSEFLKDHGFIDNIIERKNMKDKLHLFIHIFVLHKPTE